MQINKGKENIPKGRLRSGVCQRRIYPRNYVKMKKCNSCGKTYDDIIELCDCGRTLALIVNAERFDGDYPEQEYSIYREPIFKKKKYPGVGFKGVGWSGLFAGFWIFNILRFIYVAFMGLSMVALAIKLFTEGSILWGLVVLFIGTPIVTALAGLFFLPFFILTILALIIWGISHLFGFNVSFGSVSDIIWFGVKALILGGLALAGIAGFINAVRNKRILGFFKEYWWSILFFCLLFWLFFS